MNSNAQRDRSFERLRAFAHALAHSLRTPLSVIANDLAYFKSTSKSDEFDRGIRRCRELSEQLSYVCSFFIERASDAKPDLGQQVGALYEQRETPAKVSPFVIALGVILDHTLEAPVAFQTATPDLVVILGKLKAGVESWDQSIVYYGFTDLLIERFGQEIIEAPLFDSLIAMEGISTKISALDRSIKIELQR